MTQFEFNFLTTWNTVHLLPCQAELSGGVLLEKFVADLLAGSADTVASPGGRPTSPGSGARPTSPAGASQASQWFAGSRPISAVQMPFHSPGRSALLNLI